jgi:hypothetical protein
MGGNRTLAQGRTATAQWREEALLVIARPASRASEEVSAKYSPKSASKRRTVKRPQGTVLATSAKWRPAAASTLDRFSKALRACFSNCSGTTAARVGSWLSGDEHHFSGSRYCLGIGSKGRRQLLEFDNAGRHGVNSLSQALCLRVFCRQTKADVSCFRVLSGGHSSAGGACHQSAKRSCSDEEGRNVADEVPQHQGRAKRLPGHDQRVGHA